MRLKEMLREVIRNKPGLAGVILLTVLLLGAVAVKVTYTADFGSQVWSNPTYWADYPKAAEPQWTSYFDDSKIPHQILERTSADNETVDEYGKVLEYNFPAKLVAKDPTFLSFTMSDIQFNEISPVITVFLVSEEERVSIYRHVVPGKTAGETSPVTRYSQSTPLKVQMTSDFSAEQKISDHLTALRTQGAGEFITVVRVAFEEPEGSVGKVQLVAGGNVYGISGTDNLGRDVKEGILAGLPTALQVAFFVAIPSVLVGSIMGAISAYKGGKTEGFIEGLIDVKSTLPGLPILIFFVFVFGAKLSIIMALMVFFGWTGMAIKTRPWFKQIRETGFITMARARGYSGTRIVLKQLLPQILPFLFATLVLAMPIAILQEAALSFLGLGDPSIPTWGAMLKEGFQTGAINLGYWWWVLPPGLAIIITSLTGALIFYPLEKYAEPRLKKE